MRKNKKSCEDAACPNPSEVKRKRRKKRKMRIGLCLEKYVYGAVRWQFADPQGSLAEAATLATGLAPSLAGANLNAIPPSIVMWEIRQVKLHLTCNSLIWHF